MIEKIVGQSWINIPAIFNGPPGSANGGVLIGALASLFKGSYVTRLFAPPPLDTRMLIQASDHTSVEVKLKDKVIASAKVESFEPVILPAIGLENAEIAARKYVGLTPQYKYHHCYVCGMARPIADGLHIYPGKSDLDVYAAPWYPLAQHADKHGIIKPEFIVGALDCPSGIACMGSPPRLLILGTMWVKIVNDAPVDSYYYIVSRCDGIEGRKYYGSSVLYDRNDREIAHSRSIWIEIKNFATES